jgi:hypothetical protein
MIAICHKSAFITSLKQLLKAIKLFGVNLNSILVLPLSYGQHRLTWVYTRGFFSLPGEGAHALKFWGKKRDFFSKGE